jgi:Trk K+ transport system NAD-binding subunit
MIKQALGRENLVRILIIGAGEVGYHVANRLMREQHDVVIVDQSAALVERIKEELDVLAYRGHGASPAILEQAGVTQADMMKSTWSRACWSPLCNGAAIQ